MLLLFLVSFFCLTAAAAAAASVNKQNLQDLDYRIFPKRTAEEAAVLEWGHSAIISALDASVAMFGPQTVDAALLEVECRPVLASPLNGVDKKTKLPVTQLDNTEDTHGNMVVMTNTGNLTGMQMTKIAIESGAAALLVVNMDEEYPDDIYRLEVEENEDTIDVDIPVVMISLNSANVLTSATVTPDMNKDDIVNNGMPERVRLYAGGDRPFFEDVEPVDPTLYLIHNLMTSEECDALIQQASSHDMEHEDNLLLSQDTTKQEHMGQIVLWKGALQSYAGKQVEERMEQVTGFPASHYSDFVVHSLQKHSSWKPHYDILVNGQVPMATITIFLSNSASPTVVYPSIDDDQKEAVKILAQKGMAIVHHNLENQRHQLDMRTLHAWMPISSSTTEETIMIYVARKYVFSTPPSPARRIVLPMIAAPFGGTLPRVVYQLHAVFVNKFGYERGDYYFDKACVIVPLLVVLGLAQAIANYVQRSMRKKKSKTTKKD
jgi:hypothetical protein